MSYDMSLFFAVSNVTLTNIYVMSDAISSVPSLAKVPSGGKGTSYVTFLQCTKYSTTTSYCNIQETEQLFAWPGFLDDAWLIMNMTHGGCKTEAIANRCDAEKSFQVQTFTNGSASQYSILRITKDGIFLDFSYRYSASVSYVQDPFSWNSYVPGFFLIVN